MNSPLIWFGNQAKLLVNSILSSGTQLLFVVDPGAGDDSYIFLGTTAIDIYSENGDNFIDMYCDAGSKSIALSAGDGDDQAELDIKLDGSGTARLVHQGASDYAQRNYSSDAVVELIYGRTSHVFIGATPLASVAVDSAKSGTFLYVINTTLGALTLAAKTSETFNGLPTVVVAAGKAVMLIKTDTGTDFLTFSSV